MRFAWTASILVATSLLLLATTPARACEPRVDTRVVGFDTAGSHVLLRQEGRDLGPEIALVVVSLQTGKETERFDILLRDDAEAQRAALRGQRWKAAETTLKARGFSIVPLHPPTTERIKPPMGEAFSVVSEGASDEDTGFFGTALVAARDEARVVLVEAALAPASDTIEFAPLWQSPDGGFLITAHNGCFPRPFVFRVADIDARLQAAKAKAAPTTPAARTP